MVLRHPVSCPCMVTKYIHVYIYIYTLYNMHNMYNIYIQKICIIHDTYHVYVCMCVCYIIYVYIHIYIHTHDVYHILCIFLYIYSIHIICI